MSDGRVEGKRGRVRKKKGIGDLGGGEHGLSDDVGEIGVEGSGEKDKAEEVLEKGDEVGVDEVDSGGEGEVEASNVSRN